MLHSYDVTPRDERVKIEQNINNLSDCKNTLTNKKIEKKFRLHKIVQILKKKYNQNFYSNILLLNQKLGDLLPK